MPNLKKFISFASLFLLAGCLNDVNVAEELTPQPNAGVSLKCDIPLDVFDNLPDVVLYGVDTADIHSFEFSTIPHDSFYGEMGGAIIELTLLPRNNYYMVKRVYREPGEESAIATYGQVCINGRYIFSDGMRGLFTKNGILWLELNSGTDFISSDLWIYMDKK